MGRKANTLQSIFSRKVIDINGCWLYTGTIANSGYGRAIFKGKIYNVHRLSAYYYLNLDLKSDKLALHKNFICKSKRCFNPDHLYIGTSSQNSYDIKLMHESQAYCINGHIQNEDITYIDFKLSRRCKLCQADQQRIRRNNYKELEKVKGKK
jgi:hypothetical protein